jgi:hypothetical protein
VQAADFSADIVEDAGVVDSTRSLTQSDFLANN